VTGLLLRSVSGLRGVVGEALTPAVVAAHAAAFARCARAARVVVGRDARPSGEALLSAVAAGLERAGASGVDLGACATPAAQIAVEECRAGGGLVITASHNPGPWNGLKFIGPDGVFLDPQAVAELFRRAAAEPPGGPLAGTLGAREERAVTWHVEHCRRVPQVAKAAIAGRRLVVAVDGCSSVGGPSTVRALESVGARVVPLDCEPNGEFHRGLEPLPEHLGGLGDVVRRSGADFGVAHDPDGDRAALVDASGAAVGEELTLAIALETILATERGPVVVNLSTSRMADDVARAHGVPCWRSPVGEVHVVEEMRRRGAVAGGEGNGGVIVPASHYGRDGTLAALLVAARLAATGETLAQVRARLDRYTMIKARFEGVDWAASGEALKGALAGGRLDEQDGLRFEWPDAWLTARPSQTEPVVRVLVEAETPVRATGLLERARAALGGGSGDGRSSGRRGG
jgi:phosphomannomutase